MLAAQTRYCSISNCFFTNFTRLTDLTDYRQIYSFHSHNKTISVSNKSSYYTSHDYFNSGWVKYTTEIVMGLNC